MSIGLAEAKVALLFADLLMKFGHKGADQDIDRAKALMVRAGVKDLDGEMAYLEKNRDQLWAEIRAKSGLSADELVNLIENDDYRRLAKAMRS